MWAEVLQRPHTHCSPRSWVLCELPRTHGSSPHALLPRPYPRLLWLSHLTPASWDSRPHVCPAGSSRFFQSHLVPSDSQERS